MLLVKVMPSTAVGYKYLLRRYAPMKN